MRRAVGMLIAIACFCSAGIADSDSARGLAGIDIDGWFNLSIIRIVKSSAKPK